MGKFGEMNALASTTAPYQALVCIFLAGGNDSNNMVIPVATAQQSYGCYAQGRQGLAIAQGTLLPIKNGSDNYGLHPLMPEIQALYNNGNAAILTNVGMLVQPTTPAIFQKNNLAKAPLATLFAFRPGRPVAGGDSQRHGEAAVGAAA